MPDSQLQVIANEVDALFKAKDVGGFVVLSSKSHSHYLHQWVTTWSCITQPAPGAMRIRSKRADYLTKEEHEEKLRNTVGMLCSFVDVLRAQITIIEQLLLDLGKAGVKMRHVTRQEEMPAMSSAKEILRVLENKAEAFDRLIADLAKALPVESKIKHLSGLPLTEALRGFVIVPKDEWDKRKPE